MARKLDVAVELHYDGTYHDLVKNEDVFASPIVIKRGQSDEATQFRPASIGLQLANDDDMYRTSNPESPLYGKAGRNTKTRVSVGGVVRGTVEASSWVASQTRDFRARPKRGKAWVDVEGGGLLQRVGQWTEPLQSSFRQYNETLGSHVIGYWHLEQARGSTTLLSPTAGVSRPIAQNVAFDSQTRPPGSAPLMDIGDDPSEAGAYFVRDSSSSTAGWQLSWAVRLNPLVAGEQDIFDWETADGTAYGLYLDTTLGKIIIYSSLNGVPVLAGAGDTYGTYDWSQWTLFSLDARDTGLGSTNIYINWTNGDNTASGFVVVGFTGVPSNLVWWDAGTFAGIPAGSTIGHIVGTNVGSTGGVDLFSAARIAAWTGHLGETTADRFARLMTLKGLAYSIRGTAADSYPMGPQPVASFPEQLREIRDTEDGLIFDAIDDIELVFMLRNARYRQTPALTINAADPDSSGLPNLPPEVTDDLDPHNIVTASQRDGADYTVQDDTGPLGTQPPPDGMGEYRQTVDVNVSDPDDLPQVANWWLRRGTVNLPRFPAVTINLAALDASKVAEVEAVDVGSVIEITRYREYTIRLYVLGYIETITWPIGRTIVFTCAPDQQFVVGEWDATDSLWDLRTCTMSAATGIGVTTLTLAITADEAWSSTSSYDLLISGELIGVPVGGMGARTGSAGAYTQVLTGAVRSKDGVRKVLPAGAEVHASTPGRWA